MYVGDDFIMYNWLNYILDGDNLIEGKPEAGEWKSIVFGAIMMIHHQRDELTEEGLMQIIRANSGTGQRESSQ